MSIRFIYDEGLMEAFCKDFVKHILSIKHQVLIISTFRNKIVHSDGRI